MSDATLRLAIAADFDAVAAITNHYIRTTAIHFGYDEVTADELRSLWQEHEDVYPWLVAQHGGEILGYAKAGSYRTRAAYRFLVETGIYLHPDERGRGLGATLYRCLLDVLQVQGFHSAVGGIALPNDASVRLHERLGFTAVGVVREAGYKFERWHDVGFWQRPLRAGMPTQRLLTPAQALLGRTGR